MSVSYLINNPSIKLKETRMIVVPYSAVVCQTQMIFAYISQYWRLSLASWWLSFLWGSKSATGKSVKSRWETRDLCSAMPASRLTCFQLCTVVFISA